MSRYWSSSMRQNTSPDLRSMSFRWPNSYHSNLSIWICCGIGGITLSSQSVDQFIDNPYSSPSIRQSRRHTGKAWRQKMLLCHIGCVIPKPWRSIFQSLPRVFFIQQKQNPITCRVIGNHLGCMGRIWTHDLKVMNPTRERLFIVIYVNQVAQRRWFPRQ